MYSFTLHRFSQPVKLRVGLNCTGRKENRMTLKNIVVALRAQSELLKKNKVQAADKFLEALGQVQGSIELVAKFYHTTAVVVKSGATVLGELQKGALKDSVGGLVENIIQAHANRMNELANIVEQAGTNKVIVKAAEEATAAAEEFNKLQRALKEKNQKKSEPNLKNGRGELPPEVMELTSKIIAAAEGDDLLRIRLKNILTALQFVNNYEEQAECITQAQERLVHIDLDSNVDSNMIRNSLEEIREILRSVSAH
jgi:tetratricopeptide (TPR) repeat protein